MPSNANNVGGDQADRACPVKLSRALHKLIFEIASYRIPPYILGCRPRNLEALIEALITNHNGGPKSLPDPDGLHYQASHSDAVTRKVTSTGLQAWKEATREAELWGLHFTINETCPVIWNRHSVDVQPMDEAPTSDCIKLIGFHTVNDARVHFDRSVAAHGLQINFQTTMDNDLARLEDFAAFQSLLVSFHKHGASNEDVFRLASMIASVSLAYAPQPKELHREAPYPLMYASEPYTLAELNIERLISEELIRHPDRTDIDAYAEAVSNVSEPLRLYFATRLRYERENLVRPGIITAGVPGVVMFSLPADSHAQEMLDNAVGQLMRSRSVSAARHSALNATTIMLVDPLKDALHDGHLVLCPSRSSRPVVAPSEMDRVAMALLEQLRLKEADGSAAFESGGWESPFPRSCEADSLQPIRHGAIEGPDPYRFIPSEVEIDVTGRKAAFRTYIHDLSPLNEDSKAFYPLVEAALSPMISLLESALSICSLGGDRNFTEISSSSPRPGIRECPWYHYRLCDLEAGVQAHEVLQTRQRPHFHLGDRPKVLAMIQQALPQIRVFDGPQPSEYVPKARWKVDLAGRTVQMIVKLEHVKVSPNGAADTADGPTELLAADVVDSLHQQVVAIGYHYFGFENVASVEHDFHVEFNSEALLQGTDDRTHWADLYGFKHGRNEAMQNLGTVAIDKDGPSSFAFANAYLRHEPVYRLDDLSKHGRVRRLVFWLVDPSEPLISTACVIPPQVLWLRDAIKPLWYDATSRLSKLPLELLDRIFDELEESLDVAGDVTLPDMGGCIRSRASSQQTYERDSHARFRELTAVRQSLRLDDFTVP